MFPKSNFLKSPLSSLLFPLTGCLAAAVTLVVVRPAQAQQAAANPARITQAVDNSVLTTLKGNRHPLARPEFDQGPVNASLPADRMELVLKRSEGQEIALRRYLGSLQDPNSPQYRKWLTPEQFGAQYGVSDGDIQTVSTWLAAQGFKVAKVNNAKTVIEFSGSVSQLQDAFHTEIHAFVVNGERHMANVSDPQIPSALAPVVVGLSNMNNFFPKSRPRTSQPVTYNKAAKKFVPALTSGSASEGYFLYLTPADAATIYDTPNSLNLNFGSGHPWNGESSEIGIIGETDIDLTPVYDYRSLFGLFDSDVVVVVDGPDPGAVDPDAELEAYLDLEVSGALAPQATLAYYEAGNTSFNYGYFYAINRALDDNLATIVSASLQTCELYLGSSGNQLIYDLWQQAAAQGITAVVASSDSGSAGCDNFGTAEQATLGFQVNGLSSTPFNVSVGGTDYDALPMDYSKYASITNRSNYGSALGYIPELPWNNSTTNNGLLSANSAAVDSKGNTNIVAGSGGISGCVSPNLDADGNLLDCGPAYASSALTGWAKPSWQMGASLNIPNDGVRDLPDVSLMAGDGFYGAAWLICSSIDFSGNPVTECVPDANGNFNAQGVGGTSAAAPAFAGILAMVNQSQGGLRLGQANYVLYNLANQAGIYGSAFHDITTGNNAVYCASGSPDCGANLFEMGYNAEAGYDLASGLGSVDATQLINDWTKAVFVPTTLAFTINGGTSPVSITHGQAVTLNASVAGAGGMPTGDVAITSNANGEGVTYGSNFQAVLSLAGGTTGATTFNNMPGGTYVVSANYGGDVTFSQSYSNQIQMTVAKEDSVLNLTAQTFAGNVAPATSYPYGTYITLDAQPVGQSQVSSPTPGKATGSVTFTDTAELPSGVSGTVPINSFGFAELPLYYFSPANHSVSASYAGDVSFNASTATPVAFTIAQATTASTVTSSSASVSGGTFTLTAVITPNPASGAASPTGTVVFAIPGSTLGTGAVAAAQNSTNGATIGTAAITINASLLASGANTITATYSGDTNYAASSGTVSVTYTPVTVSFTLTSTAATVSSPGQSGSSTITITPTSYTGTVNLTCGLATSPTGADTTYNPACTVPASTSVTSAAPVTATASFTTTAPTSGALAYPQTNRWYAGAGGAVLACILFCGIPARRRGWRSMLGLLIFLVAMAGVGCGGGGGGGGNNGTPGTTVGTYTFTVTGTDSVTATVTSKTTVTLTVN